MSLEGSLISAPIISIESVFLLIKSGLVLLTVAYFFFSLIVLRQINMMTDTLITEVAPILRAFAVIHAGAALGIIILFIGFFFG